MTDEQKAAYIIAQAACLNAKVVSMQVANKGREAVGTNPMYLECDFLQAINDSGVHHNAVIKFFHPDR